MTGHHCDHLVEDLLRHLRAALEETYRELGPEQAARSAEIIAATALDYRDGYAEKVPAAPEPDPVAVALARAARKVPGI